MQLLKGGDLVDDRWQFVDDDVVLPVGKPIIVRFERLLNDDADYLFHCGCCLGVLVESGDQVELLSSWVKRLDIVVLSFAKFSDGRPYSSARILRDRLGFAGEIRAIGDVVIDQYGFMLRCGFDAFQIEADEDVRKWLVAADEIGLSYQADLTCAGVTSALLARHQTSINGRAA